ncbi:hypothetical protein RJ639_027190 [Escallonia herrerae]|uniref:CCHC-type domain-containing protein n=1 Tax=Escallonia herrerae TaxID=1293975 RepID=A0AA88XCY6_9ASTE|nr:hypothetical protein RJ639_027190 [Escallonia herrerae]
MDINSLIAKTDRLSCSLEPIDLEIDLNISDDPNSFIIVGKIISDRPLNKSGVKNTLLKAWKSPDGIKIQEQDNRLLFTIYNERDYHKILLNRPWTIMGSHLALREWPPDVTLAEVDLSKSPFWVRVYRLPPNRMTTNNAITIGRRIGELQQIEISKDGRLGEKGFLRLRVKIDIEKPLPKGFAMRKEGKEDAWIQFRYERLPDFCFRCGCLGHVRKWCNRDIDPTAEWNLAGVTRPYSPWIRASYEGDQAASLFQSVPPSNTSDKAFPVNRRHIQSPETSTPSLSITSTASVSPSLNLSKRLLNLKQKAQLIKTTKLQPSSAPTQPCSSPVEEGNPLLSPAPCPWVGISDFNEITDSTEKNGRKPYASSSSGGLLQVVIETGLVDLGFSRKPFTWNNRRPLTANIQERLDRGNPNMQWRILFPNAYIQHLSAHQSDHCPIILRTTEYDPSGPKPFKFLSCWTRDQTSHLIPSGENIALELNLQHELDEGLKWEESLWLDKSRH